MGSDSKRDEAVTPDGAPAAAASDLAAITERVHAEVARQIRTALDDLVAASHADRQRIAAEARQAESAAKAELAAAVAAADEKTRTIEAKTGAAVDAAYKAGAAKGLADGRERALADGKDETERAIREALTAAEHTAHMAVEAAESAARAKI